MSAPPAARSDAFSRAIVALGFLGVIVLVVLPLGAVLEDSLRDASGDGWALDHFAQLLREPLYRRACLNSLLVAAGGAAGAVLLGVPLAYLSSRFRVPGKSLLTTLAILSLLSPPFIGAYAWILLLGRAGFLRAAARELGIELPTIYGAPGVILVFTLQYYPFVFLLTAGALSRVDRAVEEAAESLGAAGWLKLRRVVLPLVFPSLSAGALIAFVLGLANFGTPMILGGDRLPVLPTLAYSLFTSEVGARPGLAAALCVLLVAISALALGAQRLLSGRRGGASSGLRPPRVLPLRGWRAWAASGTCYLIVGLSSLPLLVVVATSFRRTSGPVFQAGLGLDSYRQVLHGVPRAIVNSLSFATAATLAIVAGGVLLGYVIARRRSLATRTLDALLLLPYVIPGIVLGLGFVRSADRGPVALSGTAAILVLAYFVRRLPYTVRSSAAILQQLDPSLEEAAHSLGASPGAAFWRVTLPLMTPGILAGAILSWVTAINELSASVVLYVGRTITMPVRIYLAVLDGDFGPAAALSTVLLAATGLALFCVVSFTGAEREAFTG